ncbi:hypothetical protein EON71_00125 [bacterium]|nr:MAG: hypothetical protein EON71_00125 [bacterium]
MTDMHICKDKDDGHNISNKLKIRKLKLNIERFDKNKLKKNLMDCLVMYEEKITRAQSNLSMNDKKTDINIINTVENVYETIEEKLYKTIKENIDIDNDMLLTTGQLSCIVNESLISNSMTDFKIFRETYEKKKNCLKKKSEKYDVETDKLRKKKGVEMSTLAKMVVARNYARKIQNNTDGKYRNEDIEDVIRRISRACNHFLGMDLGKLEKDNMERIMIEKKGFPGGRFLWQLGSETPHKLGFASLQNCAAVVMNHHSKQIEWATSMMMLGVGVGFNICKSEVNKINSVSENLIEIKHCDDNFEGEIDFMVPDSREGWVELMVRTMNAYFEVGKGFTYSTINVRPEGTPLKDFGGTASGPRPLIKAVENICYVLDMFTGKRIPSAVWVDILNIIGEMVKSGNIRRSAQIMIGDADDIDFFNLKRWTDPFKSIIPEDIIPEKWNFSKMHSWRSCSNNSIFCDDIKQLGEHYWDSFIPDEKGFAKGEIYGLINRKLCTTVGRLVDGDKYPDCDIIGVNPCGEQPLGNYEMCTLGEINLPKFASKEEMFEATRYIYRILKHANNLHCFEKNTEKIMQKNMRMGISLSGYLQATDEQKSWVSDCYEMLRDYDKHYSQMKGWRTSIKLTTIKPSGTSSLIAGVTAGIHPALFKYYWRTIRLQSNTKYCNMLIKNGYRVEPEQCFDGTVNDKVSVVYFPCKSNDNAILSDNLSAIDQLEIIKRLQSEWSDNAVSCTIYYEPTEIAHIKEWLLSNYNTCVKSVSFFMKTNHAFVQAPFIPISESEYNDAISKNNNNIEFIEPDEFYNGDHNVHYDNTNDDPYCHNGACDKI